ncbi:hypothetical protein ACFLXU_04445 [Chloroflexota bacterium]
MEISYKSDVSIAGKLAMFGDRTMRAKAQKVQEELSKLLTKSSEVWYDSDGYL